MARGHPEPTAARACVQVDESLDTYYTGPVLPLPAATVSLHYNVIAGKSTIGLTTTSVGTVDAINNWWGCSGGPGSGLMEQAPMKPDPEPAFPDATPCRCPVLRASGPEE